MQCEGVDELGLGRLRRVDLRQVWKNEAVDLTPWLEKNLDVLATALGTTIIPSQREVRVGDFRLDLLGEDELGRPVIIENQLEPTDHSHLGQLLVYASGLEAAVVVWVTSQFRDEHRRALDWLNERTDEDVHFFGVELDAVCISNSPPAPFFRVVVQPNDWQKSVKQHAGNSNITDTQRRRHDFFVSVCEVIAAHRPTFRTPKVGYDNWVSMSSGPFGWYAVSFATGDRIRIEAYLDLGDQPTTKALYDSLAVDREVIEHAFGEPLAWERLPDKRASRIAAYRPAPGLQDPDASAVAREWAARGIARLMEILDSRLRQEARVLRDSSATL